MANNFSKDVLLQWADLLAGFDDACVLSNLVTKHRVGMKDMVRSQNTTVWRPQPYIAKAVDGLNVSSASLDQTQLSVPATIGSIKNHVFQMSYVENNDPLQLTRQMESGKLALASAVNVAISNAAGALGSLVVTSSTASSGYADVAKIAGMADSQGVPKRGRHLVYNAGDYYSAAANLQNSSRSFGNDISDKALRDAYVGRVAGIETHHAEYGLLLGGSAVTGVTIDTQSSANNFYVPVATSTAITGETSLVDNRFQTITTSTNTGMKEGDAFTIEGVFAVNHITKERTNTLKTFRVTKVNSTTSLDITPPIISAQGSSAAEEQYKNVEVVPDSTAAITLLNIADANVNTFWAEDAIEIIPGSLAVESGTGLQVVHGTTKNGIPLVFTAQTDSKTGQIFYRMSTLFGVSVLNPEMAGILLCNQA